MTKSLYWYDLETTGTNPRWDRIVQFAGVRTDLDLNPIGDEYCTYVELPDDVLPDPDATLVTGITPALIQREGISEWRALTKIQEIFSQGETCVTGYNSLRFDDEFIRYGFYRMLLDPYTREWQNNNSRWDIVDLVRACGALRRDGIEWPTTAEGQPVYKLELLTKANGIEHGNAHDALSDVRATIAIAKLIKTSQPRLYDYYFNHRQKKQVKKLLEPYGARTCLHVSGMYPRERYCSAPVISICRHPTNSNSIVVADLSQDIESLLQWSAAEIQKKLFKSGEKQRPPLKEIRINRCPFVVGLEVMTQENFSRMGFDRKEIDERRRRLLKPGIARKIASVYRDREHEAAIDPEAALYDAFLQDADRSRCASLHSGLRNSVWVDLDFDDKRLASLSRRLKARSFPALMSIDEAAEWREFVVAKLHTKDAPWLTLQALTQRLEVLREQSVNDAGVEGERRSRLLEALADHASGLALRYPP
jgi:exodeoxyribonuclease-1